MGTPREGLNPLRPYYVPPSIGLTADITPNSSSASVAGTGGASSSSFSFPDLDYSEYLGDTPSTVTGSIKEVLNKAIWKYTSTLIAQPFEVAKLILQVHVAQDDDDNGGVITKGERRDAYGSRNEHDEMEEDLSEDEPNFFSPSAPFDEASASPTRGRQGRSLRHITDRNGYIPPEASSPHRIPLRNPHSLLDALSALSSHSGAIAMWRGTNTTFLYTLLQRTLETFLRSMIAAFLGIPDAEISVPPPLGAVPPPSMLTSGSPSATILIAMIASAVSSLLLAPIDASRTRLILTPSSKGPGTLLATLRTLPSFILPVHLIPITFLTSTLPTLISTSTPILLKNNLKLDPVLNATTWSVATFVGSTLDLVIKFPLETVLRRAQIATWTSPTFSPPSSSSARKALETIVPVPQVYRGVVSTMWSIMREEGTSMSQKDRAAAAIGKATRAKRKGQGVAGLYRGWRVGMWGLVGIWGAAFVGGLQSGAEAVTDSGGGHGGKF